MSEQIVFKEGDAHEKEEPGQPVIESAKSTVLESMNGKLDLILSVLGVSYQTEEQE